MTERPPRGPARILHDLVHRPRQFRQFFGVACCVLVTWLGHPVDWLFPIGAAVAVLGTLTRLWGSGYVRKNDELATTGPYPEWAVPDAITTSTYDHVGRLDSTVAPNGSITTYDYIDDITYVTNELGQVTASVANSQGQTIEVTDNLGGSVGFVYAPFGELIASHDDDYNWTLMSYNSLGHRTQLVDPDVGVSDYEHDALGRVIRQIDA